VKTEICLIILLGTFLNGCSCHHENAKSDGPEVPIDWSYWEKPVLYKYINSGDIFGLNEALREHPELVNERPKSGGGGPLFHAVKLMRYDMVVTLIKSGSDVNQSFGVINYHNPYVPVIDMTGYAPIHQAIDNCDTKMVSLLISLGASSDLTYHGKTLIEYAAGKGCTDIVDLLNSLLKKSAMAAG